MVKDIYVNFRNRLLHKMSVSMPGGGTIRPWLHRMRGVKVGTNVWISQSVYIDELHPEKVTIGDNCTVGLGTSIFTHFYWGPRQRGYDQGHVVIERDVFIGPHSVILPGVTIREGAVIKAGTVVAKDVPARTLWGVPSAEALGRVTVPLTSEQGYEAFIEGLKPMRRRKPGAGK